LSTLSKYSSTNGQQNGSQHSPQQDREFLDLPQLQKSIRQAVGLYIFITCKKAKDYSGSYKDLDSMIEFLKKSTTFDSPNHYQDCAFLISNKIRKMITQVFGNDDFVFTNVSQITYHLSEICNSPCVEEFSQILTKFGLDQEIIDHVSLAFEETPKGTIGSCLATGQKLQSRIFIVRSEVFRGLELETAAVIQRRRIERKIKFTYPNLNLLKEFLELAGYTDRKLDSSMVKYHGLIKSRETQENSEMGDASAQDLIRTVELSKACHDFYLKAKPVIEVILDKYKGGWIDL
jgi:hypothetical protein